jgi:hypothetical protein
MSVEKNITNGTVTFEDGVKAKEEFAPAKKAKVELSFSVPEGQDGVKWLDAVMQIATDKVDEILGRKPRAAANEAPAAAGAEGQKAGTSKKKDKPAPAAPAQPERTKADIEREALAAMSGATAEAPAAKDEDDLSDILGDAAPTPRVFSDKELGEICNREALRIKAKKGDKYDPKLIRELVAKHGGLDAGTPKIAKVPAANREALVKELEAI